MIHVSMIKPWYKSKTAWGSLLVGGGMILTAVGKFLLGELGAVEAFLTFIAGVGLILIAVGLRDAIEKK